MNENCDRSLFIALSILLWKLKCQYQLYRDFVNETLSEWVILSKICLSKVIGRSRNECLSLKTVIDSISLLFALFNSESRLFFRNFSIVLLLNFRISRIFVILPLVLLFISKFPYFPLFTTLAQVFLFCLMGKFTIFFLFMRVTFRIFT